jgi:hypothetical protein
MTMLQFNTELKASSVNAPAGESLMDLAHRRVMSGLAPPREIYRIENRGRVDWSQFPSWAQPLDPQIFDGACHEG